MRQTNLALAYPPAPQPGSARRSPNAGGSPASPAVAHPRPWRTFYYAPHSRLSEWSRIGRAATLKGAIRAALRHLLEGSATSARVCDEDGLERAMLQRRGQTIRIVGGW
jgi:hypothetical protein